MNKNLSDIVVSSVCIIATLLLTVLMGFVAPLAIILALCSSVFVSYLYIRGGFVPTLINIIIASVVMLLLGGGRPDILIIVGIAVIPGLVSGIMQKQNYEYYSSLCGVGVAFGAVMVGLLYYASMSVPGGISEIFDSSAGVMKETIASFIKESGAEGQVSIGEINTIVESAILQTKMIIPSIIIIVSIILGYIHLMTVEFFVRRISGIKLNYIKFDMHKAPRTMTYFYFIASLILMFMSQGGTLTVVLLNATEVFDVILAFCGLSFIESLFKRKLKIGVLRGLIYVGALTLSGGLAMQLLSIVGMIDSLSDFRGIKRIGE